MVRRGRGTESAEAKRYILYREASSRSRPEKRRFVFDTNILVRATLLSDSTAGRAFRKARQLGPAMFGTDFVPAWMCFKLFFASAANDLMICRPDRCHLPLQ